MSKEYFIYVNGKKVYVTKSVYQTYWKEKNREKYLEQRDKKYGLTLFSTLDKDGHFVENLADKNTIQNVDYEKIIETKEMIDKLNIAISKLNEEEKEIVNKIFFEKVNITKIADDKNISYQAVQSRRENIIKKLKKLIDKL